MGDHLRKVLQGGIVRERQLHEPDRTTGVAPHQNHPIITRYEPSGNFESDRGVGHCRIAEEGALLIVHGFEPHAIARLEALAQNLIDRTGLH